MRQRCPGPWRLAVVAAAASLGLGAVAGAQPPLARGTSLRPLFGVDVGSPLGELEQVVREARMVCHQPGTDVIVCRGGLRRPPLQMVSTYWVSEGHIARMFQKVEGRFTSYVQYLEVLRLVRTEVERALETDGTRISGPLPAFAESLDDAGRLRALAEGRMAVEYAWSLPGAALTLSLKGDSGQPVVVLAADKAGNAPRPSPQTSPAPARCGPEQLAAALTSLFPPADPAVRAASARTLAGCGDPRAAGVLAAVTTHDPDVAVRVEAVRALVASGDHPRAAAVVADRRAPDPLRAAALEALAAAGAAPADQDLVRATRQPGPALRAAVTALGQRRPATVAAAPEAPPPETPAASAPPAPAAAPEAPAAPPVPPGAPPVIAGEPPPDRLLPPLRPLPPPPPPPPPKPWTERDGTPLAITASVAAGGLWGGSLSLLAQQDGVGVVTLLGGAGAVIGGGTAWGLTRFGLRPSAAQALWFVNSTAWGSLAGLTIWSGSGSDSPKLKYGLLVGGETLGIVAGAWSARRFHFTPAQTVFADSLVIGSGLGLAGAGLMLDPDVSWRVPPAAAIGVVPTMLGAAVASRYVKISDRDVPMLLAAPVLAGWTGGLLAAGGYEEPWLGSGRSAGGALLGVGVGYLGAAAAASFVEVSRLRLTTTTLGMLAGNAIGLGSLMVARPEDDGRWSLGAGAGGLALATTVYVLGPRLRPGPKAVPMTIMGGVYGAGTWALALAAASTGQAPDARLPGGMLAGGVAAGLGGLIASQWFRPEAYDQVVVAGGTATGMAAGLGTAKLLTDEKGTPDFAGVMGGAALGFAGGVLLARGPELRAPAFASAAIGGGYGLMVGSLLPTLDQPSWREGRKTAGASWLGLSLGVVGGTLLARDTGARGGQVALVTGAGALGAGMGAGLGWMFPTDDSQPARIGVLAGSTTLLAAGLLAEQRLQLTSHLGAHSLALGLFGGGLGLANGLLAASVVEPDRHARFAGQQRAGAALLGSSAGAAAGVLASRWLHPSDVDYAMVAGASLLGHSAGLGVARLWFAPEEDLGQRIGPPDRREPILRLGGALLGMGGGMLAARSTELRPLDLAAGGIGTGYGAVLGALAPNLHHDEWYGDRQAVGGGHLGAAIGGAAAATAAHLTDASGVEIAVPSVAVGLGGLGGLAFGAMLPTSGHQPMRVGAFSGALAAGAASLALARPLRLHEGFAVPGTAGATAVGLTLGTGNGLLLAGLLDPSGSFELTPDRQVIGGVVFGQALGATTGFLWTRFFQPDGADGAAAITGSAYGASLGLGLAMLVTDPVGDRPGDPKVGGPHGRAETAATLGGSLLGLGAAGLVQRYSPLTGADVGALVLGTSFGGLFGRLAPTLDQKVLDRPIERQSKGALLAGIGGGGLGAIALRRATGARGSTLALGGLGGVHGLVTGWGVGMLLDDDLGDSQAQRIGVTAGGAAGLVVGAGMWPHLDVERRDAGMIAAALALGGWNGAWLATLGREHKDEVSERRVWGGVAAGAGGASMLATALVPALSLEPDLMVDALVMDLYLSAAGFGAGALISRRFDALGIGVMAGGGAGLLLGGAFHRAIDVGPEDRPLHLVASLEGMWLGAWLPFMLWEREQVTARQVAGGITAGMMGGLALARLASPLVEADSQTAAGVGMGSAIGAALGGGSALLANDLNGRAAVGVMMGGTGAGMLLGGLIAPDVDLGEAVGYGTAGALLGTSEALVFAWAGRADGRADYTGAALVGAGLGSGIGLAAAAHPEWFLGGRALPAAGFAGWGAWMGSFAGALIDRNPHEVTLGGLVGANAGFLAGWGLLKADVVEPRDFGWLSAFGAAGTVVGGGVGALFSTREDSRPALAGLLVGPAVGLATGAIVLPHLKGWQSGGAASTSTSTSTSTRTSTNTTAFATTSRITSRTTSTTRSTVANGATGGELTLSTEGQETSADWDDRRVRGRREGFGQKVKSAFRPTQVIPVIGALPNSPDGPPGPPPFVFGLAGLWR